MEHRLAEEGTADGDAVQSADQLLVLPRLDGVTETESMQRHVAAQDVLGDPGLVAGRARAHHGLERGVDANLESRLADDPLQSRGCVEGAERQDATRIG